MCGIPWGCSFCMPIGFGGHCIVPRAPNPLRRRGGHRDRGIHGDHDGRDYSGIFPHPRGRSAQIGPARRRSEDLGVGMNDSPRVAHLILCRRPPWVVDGESTRRSPWLEADPGHADEEQGSCTKCGSVFLAVWTTFWLAQRRRSPPAPASSSDSGCLTVRPRTIPAAASPHQPAGAAISGLDEVECVKPHA